MLRINAGAGRFVDQSGQLWAADRGYNRGRKVAATAAIRGTRDTNLYRRYRQASKELRYSLRIPNGRYEVELHFVEGDKRVDRVGERRIHVDFEGRRKFTVDIFKAVGQGRPLVRRAPVQVQDGKLTISLKSGTGDVAIAAIAVLPAAGTQSGSGKPALTLSWYPNGDPVDRYRVYFGKDKSRINRALPVVKASDLDSQGNRVFVDYEVKADLRASKGDNVCFQILAVRQGTKSDRSDAVCTKVR